MGIGGTLMLAPALGPMLCLNDGDCTNEAQSIWKMNPLNRGVVAENLVGRSSDLVENFPVIDKFENGVATSIKSIDLFSKTYQNTGTLMKTVQGYVNTLNNWQGTGPNGGSTPLNRGRA
jgi:filamentous hemagglutinin